MLTTEMILAMIAWPAIASLAMMSLTIVPAVRTSSAGTTIAAAAVAVGFVVGYWGIVGRPEAVPPVDAKAGLPAVAMASVAVAVFVSRRLVRSWVAWMATGVFAAAAMWLVLRAAIAFQWTPMQAVVRVVVLAGGMCFVLWCARSLEKRAATRTTATTLAAVAGLGAPVMLFSDSLLMAQLHGALGISVGVVSVAAWVRPQSLSLRGVFVVVVSIAWALWVIALLFANMPLLSFALLSLALPTALAASHLAIASKPRWRAFAIVAVVFALVSGSVLTGGLQYMRTSEATTGPGGADDYGHGYGYNQ